MILGRDLSTIHPVDLSADDEIREFVSHSWYEYSGGKEQGRHPWSGETKFAYTGSRPPYQQLDVDRDYSWLKSPRWKGHAVEVGPLARTLETKIHGDAMQSMYDQLIGNIRGGDLRTFNATLWDPATWPREARGVGHMEAPRGSLGHWIVIKDGRIDNYQAVVPSTWNAGPRDAAGQDGAYEAALKGTPWRVQSTAMSGRTVHEDQHGTLWPQNQVRNQLAWIKSRLQRLRVPCGLPSRFTLPLGW